MTAPRLHFIAPWGEGVPIAPNGAIWFLPPIGNGRGQARLVHDFTAMRLDPLTAPYRGASA